MELLKLKKLLGNLLMLAMMLGTVLLTSCGDDEPTDNVIDLEDLSVVIDSDVQTVIEGESVTFNSTGSLGDPDGFAWEFEGGTPATSTDAAPTVTYSTKGKYFVKLTISRTSDGKTKGKTEAEYITVTSENLEADFTADVTNISPNAYVTFTDASVNGADSWAWEFEGGTPATSTEQNPVVQYKGVGNLKVTLTVTNSTTNDTNAKVAEAFIVSTSAATSIPGERNARDWNPGGQDISYFDTNANGPKLEGPNPDDQNIGSIDDNEWLEYDVYVTKSGSYQVNFENASKGGDRAFVKLQKKVIAMDGTVTFEDLTAETELPKTPDWHTYVVTPMLMDLDEGYFTLRVFFTVGPVNFRRMYFQEVNKVVEVPAEDVNMRDWNNGGEGMGYSDLKAEGPKLEGDPDDQNIGDTKAGEWLEYTINVAEAGLYTVGLENASNADDPAQIRIQTSRSIENLSGEEPVQLTNTGGWQDYVTTDIPGIQLQTGLQVIRFFMETGGSNYRRLTFTPEF